MDQKQCYQCIHCGHPVGELYRDFKKGIIKISHCNKCNEVADKYIEYDPVVIFLDVLLLQKPAYRHILVNSEFEGHWRLLLVLWLCDALTKLMQRKASDSSPRLQPDRVFYSALELDFYQDYLFTAIESLIFFCMVVGFLAVKHRSRHKTFKHFKLEAVMKALVISSMGRLMLVPALIWGESYSTLGVAVTHLFVASSNVQALRAVDKKITLLQAAAMVSLGYGIQAILLALLMGWLPQRSVSPIFLLDITHLLPFRK